MNPDSKNFWQILNTLETLKERVDDLIDWQEQVNKILDDHNIMFDTYRQFLDYFQNEINFLKTKRTPV